MYSASFIVQCLAALGFMLLVSEANLNEPRELSWGGGSYCCSNVQGWYEQCCNDGIVNLDGGSMCHYRGWEKKCAMSLEEFLEYKRCRDCSGDSDSSSEDGDSASTQTTTSALSQESSVSDGEKEKGSCPLKYVLIGGAVLFAALAGFVAAVARRRRALAAAVAEDANTKASVGTHDDSASLEEIEVSKDDLEVPKVEVEESKA